MSIAYLDVMKSALVTGSARRLGRAIAIALGREGYNIHVHCCRSLNDAEETARQVRDLGVSASVVVADLADIGQAAGLIARCKGLGPLTCLVNNAALYEPDGEAGLDAASFDRQMAVNLRAPLALASAFAAQLPEGMPGLILNILDSRTAALPARFTSYCASKAALAAATEMLALSLGPRIRVNAIAPGLVMDSASEAGVDFDRIREANLLKRRVDLGDIAAAATYLLHATAVTGQTIYVDSGQRFTSTRYLK
jgi:NAD(P)-dependent dehydrogenase (short-subunit alcohol dehydrogenase family)